MTTNSWTEPNLSSCQVAVGIRLGDYLLHLHRSPLVATSEALRFNFTNRLLLCTYHKLFIYLQNSIFDGRQIAIALALYLYLRTLTGTSLQHLTEADTHSIKPRCTDSRTFQRCQRSNTLTPYRQSISPHYQYATMFSWLEQQPFTPSMAYHTFSSFSAVRATLCLVVGSCLEVSNISGGLSGVRRKSC